ncbi:FAD/NAD(P)-binding oxidoreductase family protein [Rhynchospora pubera]|uniref:FAD/NAD(P)-binding oxidoreductase family protein n=1 Tax=Rhynchospora pubera TaxID=906938 RepID=A0AAV8E4H7_9POAL|nr:FAD/NAD(P)-binding oxidoreductase family protein [Rhynchospora pubera]
MEHVEEIVIVGAGIAGLATALGLHRKGVKSLVLESFPSIRTSGYAIGTWTNAWRALDALGIGNKIREQHILVERFKVFSPSSGAILREAKLEEIEGKTGKIEIRCVRREFLLQTLAQELPKDTIRYSSKVVLIEEEGDLKLLHLADGSVIKTKVLIGGDGINSIVGKYLGMKKPSSTGRLAVRGFAEYPTNHGFKPEFIQINGQGFRVGMSPSTEKSIYWYFGWYSSENGKDESTTKTGELILIKLSNSKAPNEIIEVIQKSEMDQMVPSPLKYRTPFSLLFGNITKRNICVIGDAFHPMTPDLGQGGCIALEDSVILSRCLSEAVHQGKIEEGLEKFAKVRRWRCAKVVLIAYIVEFIYTTKWELVYELLREKVLAGIMAGALLMVANYDCGEV